MIAQALIRLTYYFKIAYSISFRLDFNALDGFYSGIIVYLQNQIGIEVKLYQ